LAKGSNGVKEILIIDCGPSLSDVTKHYGVAPEWIMESLKNKGCNFTLVKPYVGENVQISNADAWIITGSPRSVYDADDWMVVIERELKNIQSSKIPVLGICFGHQLLAKCFGGIVELNPKGWELGAYPVQFTDAGKKSQIFSGMDDNAIVYESHQDSVIVLPEMAIELARNNKGNQAFKIHDNFYGVQFHPEFSWEVIKMYVSKRSATGVTVDDPSIPESTQGELVLFNFIDLI
jgi:GMP synthase (glutamine-hydrolysing)